MSLKPPSRKIRRDSKSTNGISSSEHEGRAARARVLASDELEAGVVEHQVDDDGDGARVQHHHRPGPRALAQAVAHGGPDRPASGAGHELQVVAVGVAHRVRVGEEARVGHQRGGQQQRQRDRRREPGAPRLQACRDEAPRLDDGVGGEDEDRRHEVHDVAGEGQQREAQRDHQRKRDPGQQHGRETRPVPQGQHRAGDRRAGQRQREVAGEGGAVRIPRGAPRPERVREDVGHLAHRVQVRVRALGDQLLPVGRQAHEDVGRHRHGQRDRHGAAPAPQARGAGPHDPSPAAAGRRGSGRWPASCSPWSGRRRPGRRRAPRRAGGSAAGPARPGRAARTP